MQTCTNCGNSFEGNFCPECGAPSQDRRSCPACGAELNATVKFCPSCGAALTGEQPKPAEQVAQSPHTPILSSAAKLKLFSAMGFVPPILLLLFGGLVFAFLAAPVFKVHSEFLGITGQLNGYEILTEAAIEFETLNKYIVTIEAIGALSIPAAFLLFYFAVVYPKAKINYKNFAVYIAYLFAVILGAYVIGYIQEEDGGLNVITVGEFSPLLIGFASGFAALSLASLAVRLAVVVQFGGFSEFAAARSKRFEELLDKFPLTEEMQAVPKPSFRKLPKMQGVPEKANRFQHAKRRLLVFFFFATLLNVMLFYIIAVPNNFSRMIAVSVSLILILYLTAAAAVAELLSRHKRITGWGKAERSILPPLKLLSRFHWERPISQKTADTWNVIGICLCPTLPILMHLLIFVPFGNFSSNENIRTIDLILLLIMTLFALAVYIWCTITVISRNRIEKELKGATEKAAADFEAANAEYDAFREQLKAYREYKTARASYRFRRRFYAHGWAITNPPRPVLNILTHKLLISVSAIVLAVLIAIPSAVLPAVTNMFRPSALTGFKLGAPDYTVQNVLPRPDERTDDRWEYYSKNYAEILTEIRQNEQKIEDAQDMQTVEKLQAKNKTLYNRLGQIEYKYIAVSFDLNEYGEPVVSHVLLDTARCNADPQAKKEVKSLTITKKQIGITDAFTNGAPEIPTQIYYTDGSFQRYYLPASAFTYVDFSQTGVYRIEWSDAWGNYSANLTVTR